MMESFAWWCSVTPGVTIDSIRNHAARHFPVQNTAHAAYRQIVERRVKDNGTDFINATGTAVTALAYLETVMMRGYQTLIDEGTVVTPMEGLKAALKLHELLHRDANPAVEIDRMRGELDRIIAAIREVVPEELWPQLLDKLDDDEHDQAAVGRPWPSGVTRPGVVAAIQESRHHQSAVFA